MTVLTPLGDKRVVEKQEVTFECVFSKPDKPATWTKQDKPIGASDRVQIGVDGGRHFLTIKSSVLDDEAVYKVQVENAVSAGKLIVEGRLEDSLFSQGIFPQYDTVGKCRGKDGAILFYTSVGIRSRQMTIASGWLLLLCALTFPASENHRRYQIILLGKRHMYVGDWPRVVDRKAAAESRTCDLLIAIPAP